MIRRHVVAFAGSAVAIETDGPAADEVVRFLFDDPTEAPRAEPAVTFGVAPADVPGTFRLTCSGEVLNQQDTPGAIAAHLACEAARHIAERSAGGTLFHAGVVAWKGAGVVLPGISGAGKTTLCAHLVEAGFDYLSDELAFVPLGEGTVDGFGRPLSLKPGAWPALEAELAAATAPPHVLATGDGVLLRPHRLNPNTSRRRPALAAFVFPRRAAGAPGALRRLTRAEAALAMLANVVNARNLPGDGLTQVIALTRHVPSYEAVYDDGRSIVSAIKTLFDRRPHSGASGRAE